MEHVAGARKNHGETERRWLFPGFLIFTFSRPLLGVVSEVNVNRCDANKQFRRESENQAFPFLLVAIEKRDHEA